MAEVDLNLVVIRSSDLDRAAHFYTQLGLRFERHRHGQGVEHRSALVGSTVFEIYPGANTESTAATWIGFHVEGLAAVITALQLAGGTVVMPIHDSPWGRRVVIADPDGHRVELTSDGGERI
jgi:lactoylglutathione lyase